MICDKTRECAEKTSHIMPAENRKKGKGKKAPETKMSTEDVYKQPLSMPPCSDVKRQKECIAFLDRRSQAKCTENGKSYVLDQSEENPRHEVMMYHIDQGIISGADANKALKCDYALLIRDSVAPGGAGTAILVELKGSDTRHAVRQISATLKQKELQPLWNGQKRIYGRIICRSASPRIQSTEEFLDVQEAFIRRGGRLNIFEESKVEKYADLK